MLRIIPFFIFLGLSTFIEATFVQAPSQPVLINKGFFIPDTSLFNVRLGFEEDYLRKKRLKVDSSSHQLRNFWLNSLIEMGSIILNVKEWFDAYGFLGRGNTHLHFYNGKKPLIGISAHQFFWLVGGKLIIFERRDLCFGVDVKAMGTSSCISFREPLMPNHFSFFEWQIAAGLAQKIYKFTPYFGVTFTSVRIHLKPFEFLDKTSLKLDQKDLIGIFMGLSFSPGSYFSVGGEVRLINETAFSGSLEFRF